MAVAKTNSNSFFIGHTTAHGGGMPSLLRDAMSNFNRSKFSNTIPSILENAIAISGHWDGVCRVEADPPSDDTPPTPDSESDGLKSALEKERQARKDFEKQLKQAQRQMAAFRELGDPDAIRKAMDVAAQQDKLEEQRAKERLELEASLKQKYEPQLQQAQQQLAQQQQQFMDYKRDTLLQEAFLQSDGLPGEFVAIAHALQPRVRIGDDGKPVVLDANGEPDYVMDSGIQKPKSITQLIDELKSDPQYLWFARHFKGSNQSGFGTQNGQGFNGDSSLNGLSGWERVTAIREKRGRA